MQPKYATEVSLITFTVSKRWFVSTWSFIFLKSALSIVQSSLFFMPLGYSVIDSPLSCNLKGYFHSFKNIVKGIGVFKNIPPPHFLVCVCVEIHVAELPIFMWVLWHEWEDQSWNQKDYAQVNTKTTVIVSWNCGSKVLLQKSQLSPEISAHQHGAGTASWWTLLF